MPRLCYYLTKKAPFGTPDLRLATFPYMLEFFQATTSFNLPPVRQCGAKVFANVIAMPAFTNRWTTRGDSARLASSTGWSARGDALFQELFILNSCLYLYWGLPLPKKIGNYELLIAKKKHIHLLITNELFNLKIAVG